MKLHKLLSYRFTSRLSSSLNNTLNTTPEKAANKPRTFERWATYWKNLYKDYKEAALDAAKDCKEHPLQVSTYVSILATGIYLNKHNPSELTLKEELLLSTIKIMQVAQNVRNPIAENYVKWLGQCYNEGIVRRLNLGIVSFIWLDDYDEMCALYKAICPYLKIRWLMFHERVIDIGFMDKWWVLENKMKDYDVNDEEFRDTTENQINEYRQ